MKLTPEDVEKLRTKQLANVIRKLNEEKTLTAREEALLAEQPAAAAAAKPAPARERGRPAGAMRWTVEHAATEFGLDRRTLTKRLRAEPIEPGEDGRFATAQILKAVLGDLDRERIRNESASADLREMKRDQMRARLLPAPLVAQNFESFAIAVRTIILASDLSDREKQDILRALKALGQYDYSADASPDDADAALDGV